MKTMLVTVLLALGIAATADAQIRQLRPPAELQDAFQPDFVRRDLSVFEQELDLEPNQLEIITTLFNDYEETYRAGANSARERMNAIRPQRARSEKDIRVSQTELRREIEAMREAARARAAEAPDEVTRRRIMDEYEAELRERMQELEDEMRGLGYTDEGREDMAELLEQMAAVAREWRVEGDRLGVEFVENTTSLLDETQRERWPVVERRLRREKTIARGRLSGESVDLIAIVRGLEIDEETGEELTPMLAGYDLRLDAALKARNDSIAEIGDALYRSTHEADTGRAAELAARQIDLHRAVRDVNEEYIPAIATILPEAVSSSFRDAVNRGGFARVYRPTPAARTLKAATRLTGLDDDQREAVIALEAEYQVLLVDRNDDLRRTIVKHEPLVQQRRFARMGRRIEAESIEPIDDPIREAFDARRVFGDGYVDRLRLLLTEDQLRRVPGAARSAVTTGR